MFGNHYKIVLRNFRKNLINNTISVLGLAIGMACCLMVFLYAQDEFSFDNFHDKEDRLYRVLKPYFDEDGSVGGVNTIVDPALAQSMVSYFPEVHSQSQMREVGLRIKLNNEVFNERVTVVAPAFFEMFSFNLIDGSASDVLKNPDQIVLTRSAAQKYFGRENPVGKKIEIGMGAESRSYIVSGLADNPPRNSSIQFQILINMSNYPWIRQNPTIFNDTGYDEIQTFIQLGDHASLRRLQGKIDGFVDQHYAAVLADWNWKGADDSYPFSLTLQPISDLHFNEASSMNSNFVNHKKLILTLALVAFVILLISIFNYINLSIGIATKRAKEIGVRKVVGGR